MDVIFFNQKVKNSLYSFEGDSLSKIIKYIDLLKTFGHQLRMPYSKMILRNLYELRVHGQQEVRIFYCFHHNQAVVVHAFIKKSQKTPQKEIDTALSRINTLTLV